MKFCWSTLRVKNMEESIKFYTEILGLEVVSVFGGHGMEIAFLGKGDTKIELVCSKEGGAISVGDDISWGFEVESLDKALAMVKEKGIPLDGGPIQPNPHVKFFFIRDPNGMKLQLVENM